MEEIRLRENDDYIKLGQALKLSGIAMSGAEAHRLIEEERVLVNGEKESRRGRKLYPGDVFVFENRQVSIGR